ncbi:uncharacterized protein [Mytilus edulis]|uniref:uncharacterized protein n=1 Tax=Mytilus edulis TaxID=6550 RepID=UPI0039F02DB3
MYGRDRTKRHKLQEVINIAVCTDETEPNDTSTKKSSRLQYVRTRQNQTTQASISHQDCSMYGRDRTKRHKLQEVINIAVCTDETEPNDTSTKKSSRLQYVRTRQNQTTQASRSHQHCSMYRRDRTKRHKHQEVIKIAVCTDETEPNDTSFKKSSTLQYVPTRQNQTTQAPRSHQDCSMYGRDRTKRHKLQEVINIAVCTDETEPNDTSTKKSSRLQYVRTRQNQTTQASISHQDCSMYGRDRTKRHKHQEVIKIAVCTDETEPNDTSTKKSSRLQYVRTIQNQTTQASISHQDCSMYGRDRTKRHKHQEVIKIAVCTDETEPNDTSTKKSSRLQYVLTRQNQTTQASRSHQDCSMYRRDRTKRHKHQEVIKIAVCTDETEPNDTSIKKSSRL